MSRDQETSEVPDNLHESAKEIALGILRDVPKNKDDVLFHIPEYRWLLQEGKCPASGQDLAERQIEELQQVTFLKGDKENKSVTDGSVGPISSGPVIYIVPAFHYQYLGKRSRPRDLIRGVSGFLPRTKQRSPETGPETGIARPDRGERAGDRFRSRSKELILLSKTRERTLRILNDALNKKDDLLVENAEDLLQQRRFRKVPLISPSLVENLIATLKKVTFCKDRPDEMRRGHANEKTREKGHLGPQFWVQNKYLGLGSRPGTLILETARFLGYELFPAPKEDGAGKSGRSLTAYDVCWAFETWMNHDGFYTNNEYSCCGERARDSVCVASKMASRLH
ncbi:uncharacterized protein LOC128501852 [Spea bombifrons]|uniref:uncharacterized protein LOC128501852 n=1 Tax=Spea bombifrons TaxID=233779 RepID=UPI00234A5B8A|nr:uncharacterized protein LOC128501852 [Spea bombifrons]